MRRRQVLAAVVGAGVGSLAGCLSSDCPPRSDGETPPDGWPMPGSNPANTSTASESDGGPSIRATDDAIAESDDEDATAEIERWRADLWETTDDPIGGVSAPVVADGMVYVVAADRLHALALADGSHEWTFATGYETSPPAVGEDAIYSSAKNVYAIDRDSGTERWRHVNLAPESSTLGDSDCVPLTTTPAIAGDLVAVGFGALDRDTGDHLWGDVGNDDESEYFHGATRALGPAMGGHAIANGALYATTFEGRLAKVVP